MSKDNTQTPPPTTPTSPPPPQDPYTEGSCNCLYYPDVTPIPECRSILDENPDEIPCNDKTNIFDCNTSYDCKWCYEWSNCCGPKDPCSEQNTKDSCDSYGTTCYWRDNTTPAPSPNPDGGSSFKLTRDDKLIIDKKDIYPNYYKESDPKFKTNPITSKIDITPADSFQFHLAPDPKWFPGMDDLPHNFKTAAEADAASKKVKYFSPFSFNSYGKNAYVTDFTKPLPVDFKNRDFKCYRNENKEYKWNDCKPCSVVNSLCEALNTEEQCLEHREYCDWDRSTRCKNKLKGVSDVYANTLCGEGRKNVTKNFCITDLKKGSPEKPALYKPINETFSNNNLNRDALETSPNSIYLIFITCILLFFLFFPRLTKNIRILYK